MDRIKEGPGLIPPSIPSIMQLDFFNICGRHCKGLKGADGNRQAVQPISHHRDKEGL
jgi:hypothetical protein